MIDELEDGFHTWQVPGRICLMGDKIDLIGLPVIAAAIDTLMTIKIRKLDTYRKTLY